MSSASARADAALAALPSSAVPAVRVPAVDATNQAQSQYLDVLRGVAAQLVLLQHAVVYSFPASGYDQFGFGALGVLVFFLLSGFLITHTVAARVRRGAYSLSEFLVSRFSRIFTPYVPAILLVALLDWFMVGSPLYEYAADYTWWTAIANVLMLQDFPLFQVLRRLHVPEQPWFFRSFGSGRQFWTVSIEWWIYVLVGRVTAMAVARSPWPWRRRGSVVFLAALAFAAIEPAYNLVGGPGNCLTYAWLVGGAASVAYYRIVTGPMSAEPAGLSGSWLRAALVAALGGLVLLAAARLFFTRMQVYDAVFATLLAGILFVPFLYYRGVPGHTVWRRIGLDRLAFGSYSLYLTHGSLLTLIAVFRPELLQGWRGVAVAFVASNLLAIPFAFAFERPHRHVRRWLLGVLHGKGTPA